MEKDICILNFDRNCKHLFFHQYCRRPQYWILSSFIWCQCYTDGCLYCTVILICISLIATEKSVPCLVTICIFIAINWLLMVLFLIELFTFSYWYEGSLCIVRVRKCILYHVLWTFLQYDVYLLALCTFYVTV